MFVGRKRLDVAIDAAIVCNEGETGTVPIFSIPGLSVCTFMKLGFVEIDRNESQTLKSKLFKLASPQEKNKQVAQAATWVGYDSYEDNYPIMWDVKLESFVKPLDPNLDWCAGLGSITIVIVIDCNRLQLERNRNCNRNQIFQIVV